MYRRSLYRFFVVKTFLKVYLNKMYSWVSTEFRRHGIPPSTQNTVNMEFRRNGIPSTRNFVDTEFRRHGIPSTRNSVDTESTDTEFILFFFTSIYLVCYAMLFLFVPTLMKFCVQKYAEFCGIPRNFADFKSQSLLYV